MVEIKTARLILLPWSDDYLDDLARIFADPEVRRYVTAGERPLSRDACVKMSNHSLRLWDEYGFGPWAAIDRNSGRWIGKVGLDLLEHWPGEHKWEVGWEFDLYFGGRGSPLRAVRLASDSGSRGLSWSGLSA